MPQGSTGLMETTSSGSLRLLALKVKDRGSSLEHVPWVVPPFPKILEQFMT